MGYVKLCIYFCPGKNIIFKKSQINTGCHANRLTYLNLHKNVIRMMVIVMSRMVIDSIGLNDVGPKAP